jgi:hypothetical protein
VSDLTKRTIDDAKEAAVAATAAYLAAPAGTKTVAAAVALGPYVERRLSDLWEWRRRQLRLGYIAGYLEGTAMVDPAVVEAEIDALADDAKIREIVFDSLRVLDEARCNEVVLGMARLTRRYRSENLPPDWFSRGMRRLLIDLTSEGVAVLREVLRLLGELTSEHDEVRLAYFYATDRELRVERFGRGQQDQLCCVAIDSLHPATSADITRLVLEQLKASGLARETTTPLDDGLARPVRLVVALSTVRGVLHLMS